VTRRIVVGGAAGASAGLAAVLAGFSSVFGIRTAANAAIPAPATTTGGTPAPPAQQPPPPVAVATPTGAATPNAPATVAAAPPAPAPTRHPAPTTKPSPPPRPAGRLVAKVGDVPVGGGTVFPDEAVVLTQPTQGQFKAFSATCTHQGCTVAGVQSSDIVCGCHGSRFSIQDGSVRQGPAQAPLARRTINVDGGNLYLV
jgi:Rieske Fe-S protein